MLCYAFVGFLSTGLCPHNTYYNAGSHAAQFGFAMKTPLRQKVGWLDNEDD